MGEVTRNDHRSHKFDNGADPFLQSIVKRVPDCESALFRVYHRFMMALGCVPNAQDVVLIAS